MILKGTTVYLYEKVKVGVDNFNAPIYKEEKIAVENVLIAPSSTNDITTSTDLLGKKAVYTLAIPKGDNHNWKDAKVEFFGETYRTFGFIQQTQEELTPLDWNKKVMVEIYE